MVPDSDPVATSEPLAWVTPESLASPPSERMLPSALLPRKRRRPGYRVALMTPAILAATLGGTYAVTTAVWPVAEQPVVSSRTSLPDIIAPPAAISWPIHGTAALTVEGFGTVEKSSEAAPMASIAKTLLTAMVLEKMPLELGEQGPDIQFEGDDYMTYLLRDESALPVPESGTMSQYDLLLGIMLGSANNYTDLIARQLWGDNESFREAALDFLERHDITGIDPHTPSGAGLENTATARGLNELGAVAMQDPVFAEIVATKVAVLPGVPDAVENHNALLDDPGVLGIKSGTERYDWMPEFEYFRNLLVAKEVDVEGETLRIYTTVLEQDSEDERNAAARALLTAAEEALKQDHAVVPAGTVVGTVTTPWGGEAQFVTTQEARVLGFNQSAAKVSMSTDLGDARSAQAPIGSLTLTGPVDTETVDVVLSADLPDATIMWRWTHPFEVYGLDLGTSIG